MKKNILFFGGSFNPPHRGHREVIEYLAGLCRGREAPFQEVWVVPTFSHPFDKSLADFPLRFKMCEIMIAGLEPWVKVLPVEGRLAKTPSYTIDVVEALMSENPTMKFTLVLGSDCKKDLPRWKDYSRLKELVDFHFIPRAGFEKSHFFDVSSTSLRDLIAKGEDYSSLVQPEVARFIDEKRLYLT